VLLELKRSIYSAMPATSQQKWLHDRMKTAVSGLVNLQRVTEEYLVTQNDRARQQRQNIDNWLAFFVLQINLDIKWVCPPSDGAPAFEP
jgi:hypothetical protein